MKAFIALAVASRSGFNAHFDKLNHSFGGGTVAQVINGASAQHVGPDLGNVSATVPMRYRGAFRQVYPGFLQLAAFVNMGLDRHVRAHIELYEDIVSGNRDRAATTRAFYDEYFAVLDLTAEFYLETVRLVFQEYALARGTLTFQGHRVDPKAIRKTTLFTVEGERDDICAVGQTVAAHELCSSLRPYRKRHHMQPGVGHYGVFSGKRWTGQIYPILKNVILASD